MPRASTLKQQIQDNTVAVSIAAIPTALTGLLSWAWPGALQKISDAAFSVATPKQLLAALCISLFVNAVLVTLLISSRSPKPNQKLKYGAYWDREGSSYCPSCEKPTSQIRWSTYQYNGQGTQWHGLHCPVCENTFLLMNNGQPIHAQDAMREMQKKLTTASTDRRRWRAVSREAGRWAS